MRGKPKLGPYLERIEEILESGQDVPRKQWHTAKRIFERIRAEGYPGQYTMVKDAVLQLKRVSREVYMPWCTGRGVAQVDFGLGLAKVAGVLRKVALFVMALPCSDAFFVMAFEREYTEAYWEGHPRAFDLFGGMPSRISYDIATSLVARIIGPREKQLTTGFMPL